MCGSGARPETPTCAWCSQAMDAAAVEELEAEQRETRAELLRIARDDPELLDDLDRVEQFIELGDENPEILREAREAPLPDRAEADTGYTSSLARSISFDVV